LLNLGIKLATDTADIINNEVIFHKGDGPMDIESVASMSMAMSQASLSQQVSIAVTKKAMTASEESAQALVRMMELSVNPNLGSNINVSV